MAIAAPQGHTIEPTTKIPAAPCCGNCRHWGEGEGQSVPGFVDACLHPDNLRTGWTVGHAYLCPWHPRAA